MHADRMTRLDIADVLHPAIPGRTK
jgi:hypothetical protein